MNIHIREQHCPKRSRHAEKLARHLNRRGVRAHQVFYNIDRHHEFSNCVQISMPMYEKKVVVYVLDRNKVIIPFESTKKLVVSREELISHLRSMVRDKLVYQ